MRTPRPKRRCAPAHRRPSCRHTLLSFPCDTSRHTLRRSIPPRRSFRHPAPTLHSGGPFRPSFLPPRQSLSGRRCGRHRAASRHSVPPLPDTKNPGNSIPGIIRSFHEGSARHPPQLAPPSAHGSAVRTKVRTAASADQNARVAEHDLPMHPGHPRGLRSARTAARNRRSAPETPPSGATRCGTDRSRPARPCRASPPARRSPARRTPAYRPRPPCRPRP